MPPSKLKFKTEFELSGTDDQDAMRRLHALRTIEQHLETDVLEILASKAHKPGINGKVRVMKNMI